MMARLYDSQKHWASIVSNDADALDLLRVTVNGLTLLQRHILSMRQLDQVLDAILDRQCAIGVHSANIAGFEPTITSHDLLCLFLQLEVALHHGWTTEPDLTRSIVASVLSIWHVNQLQFQTWCLCQKEVNPIML